MHTQQRVATLLSHLLGLYLLLAGTVQAQTFFTDATATALGIHSTVTNTTFGDFNNDGHPDIMLSGPPSEQVILLHNLGNGHFAEHSAIRTRTIPFGTWDSGAVFGDYDNDGDLDLYLPLQEYHDVILRNDWGTFSDWTQDLLELDGTEPERPWINSSIWLDYDRDGLIDLLVGYSSEVGSIQLRLYRNQGAGQFADATVAAKLDILVLAEPGSWVGGIAAGDFNNDAWPDLYIGISQGRNRLFINDRQGSFEDATTEEIADVGPALDVAVGDIDNDGDLDILQATGSPDGLLFRSRMLLNQGGRFLDFTEGLGLSALGAAQTAGVGLADFDNDGDLDLVTAFPHFLFINNGDGLFIDETARSGIRESSSAISLGDYDLDGYIDLVTGCGGNSPHLYRNTGGTNHWLQVGLIGTRSNRMGIGARLIAHTGTLTQTREILGGLGYHQDEMVAHFGLGSQPKVDTLEIRWPSGQVDFINNIPADQEIRVIEGRGEWYPAPRTVWTAEPPASVTYGQDVNFVAAARPTLFEPTATITSVVADLSGLGGPEAVPLTDQGDGTYRLESSFTVGGESQLRDVSVLILQETSLGEHWIKLSRNVEVQGDPFTAVLETRDGTVPDDFALNQNFPNPFNAGTVIQFSLPTASPVELAVFNLAGQKVATLAEGVRTAGQYRLEWDGRDDGGRELASGVYLYRLQAGDQVETRKLLLLR
ncbi:MAG: T9SS type A sorting domain-containing protein [Candidatus Latescibacteria bacterium]|nr:T9SS type A sorting domain-containing protein [Candidatus Latescibacterota bacterium]